MQLDVGNFKVLEELAVASFGIKTADGQLATQWFQFFHQPLRRLQVGLSRTYIDLQNNALAFNTIRLHLVGKPTRKTIVENGIIAHTDDLCFLTFNESLQQARNDMPVDSALPGHYGLRLAHTLPVGDRRPLRA